MTITLQDFLTTSTDYVARHNNNNAVLEAAINALQASVLGTVGPGGPLITDVFDRPGLVGAASYQLDLENYSGGVTIDIGRRPAPVTPFGETNVSIAWGLFSGGYERVTMTGDATLDASAIVAGLPKTIYVIITSNGAPQLVESDSLPTVLYAYSMTWDGYSLTDFKRLAPILGGNTLLQSMAGRPELITLFDPETNWVSDEQGMTAIMLPGSLADNGFAEMSAEVLGFWVNAARADDDGFSAPTESLVADDNHVKWKITSEGEDWTSEDFDFDCSNVPDVQFIAVNPAVGDAKFVTEARTFEMERTHLGDNVVCARAFQWGVIVRPLYGLPIPKDIAFVDLI